MVLCPILPSDFRVLSRPGAFCAGIGVLIGLAPSGVAHACSPSGWNDLESDAGLPTCVDLDLGAEGEIEIDNACSNDLVLAAMGCSTCTVPGVIAAGESGIIELGSPQADALVEIDFESGAASGAIGFEYRYNPCPNDSGDGCTVASVKPSSAPSLWAAVLLCVALLGIAGARWGRTEKPK